MCAQHCMRPQGKCERGGKGSPVPLAPSTPGPESFDTHCSKVGVTHVTVRKEASSGPVNIVPQQAVEEQDVGLGPRVQAAVLVPSSLLPSWWVPEEPGSGHDSLALSLAQVSQVEKCKLDECADPALIKYPCREELTSQGLLTLAPRAGGLRWPLLERRQPEQRSHVPLRLPLIKVSALATSPHAGCAVTNGITACQGEQQDL